MRCKPNDLAIVVASMRPENNGIFVKVLSWNAEDQAWNIDPLSSYIGAEGQPMPAHNPAAWAPDSILQPIRGLPQEVVQSTFAEA
jgi:hypothetical protein